MIYLPCGMTVSMNGERYPANEISDLPCKFHITLLTPVWFDLVVCPSVVGGEYCFDCVCDPLTITVPDPIVLPATIDKSI
ncbi:hypothetical protein DERP_003945 [Dermatophagoides pteronyssinus]|uniref:Uncharacterized protein n=1 Tax=Dermatophagoides pteronyssinus TaxID=6956 RepID=A0ABQ8J875_DERPT|nr:hypothetical protein DERP_003945 [Dermatophagoides pteronyssinus]